MHTWDPERYLTFADERGRPFVELLGRVGATNPRRVVDLGCGPGNLTELLKRRWPAASVLGVDSSPEMIARAGTRPEGERAAGTRPDGERAAGTRPDGERAAGTGGGGGVGAGAGGDAGGGGGVEFRVGDLRTWTSAEPVDVLLCNATLQWVPDHLDLLPRLVRQVTPGGWFAFQVPGNFDAPSHTIRRDLAAEQPYAGHTADVASPDAFDAEVYLQRLAALGCRVDAWETTYLHVLTGEDPVFAWVSGTGARPTLQALPDDLRPGFEDEFKRRLRAAYPPGAAGVVMPFRRVFVVAQVSA